MAAGRRLTSLKCNVCRILKPVLLIAASIVTFQGLLIAAYEVVEGSELIDILLRELEAASERAPRGPAVFLTNPAAYIAMGWHHPFVLILLASYCIQRGIAAIAGEVESGTGELLFTRPERRWKLAGRHWLVTIAGLGLICLLGTWGTIFWLGYNGITEGPAPAGIYAVGSVAFLLFAAVTGYSYLISVLVRRRGAALGMTIGLTLLLYILDILGEIRAEIEPYRPFSLFYYFQPFDLLRAGEFSTAEIPVLLIPALLCAVATFVLIEVLDL